MALSKWPEVKEKLIQVEAIDLLEEEQRYFYIGQEKQYEQYIADNLNDICEGFGIPKVKKIIRQARYDFPNFSIKPDIIVIHEDDTYSVFEIKCTNPKYPCTSVTEQTRAIGQLLLYKSTLKEIYGASPRMFLVDTKIHKRTVLVFSEMELPITLIEVQNDRVFIPYMNHKE
jgi:hypothetical protein